MCGGSCGTVINGRSRFDKEPRAVDDIVMEIMMLICELNHYIPNDAKENTVNDLKKCLDIYLRTKK